MSRNTLKAMLLAGATALGLSSAGAADVPLPKIWDSLPVTAKSHPWAGAKWMNTPLDLAKYGYVEDEYLISGRANVYDWIPFSDYKSKVVASGPYTTRILVRKPKDMSKFSGRVVVEIINMSAGYDWMAMWSALFETMLDDGDVYVGITSKPNVFGGMQTFDRPRYAALAMDNPLPPAKQACGGLPGEPDYNPNLSKLYENGLAYDVFSQVGALVRSSAKSNPLGVPATSVYLSGESQSGNYLITYFKYIHDKAQVTEGGEARPVFDGYLAEAAISPAGAPISQCAQPLPDNDPQAMKIPGRTVPLFLINSQWDFFPIRGYPRKPDSNTATDKSRTWELAGSNHGWRWQYLYGDASPADLKKIGFSEYNWSCPPRKPEVPLYMAEKMAYKHLTAWAEGGPPPPRAPRIRLNHKDEVVYDANGTALGGLRLPMIEAPTAAYGPGQYALSPNCSEIVEFDKATLKQLYPTHASYISKFSAAAEKLVADGFLEQSDARKLVKRAEGAPIPK